MRQAGHSILTSPYIPKHDYIPEHDKHTRMYTYVRMPIGSLIQSLLLMRSATNGHFGVLHITFTPLHLLRNVSIVLDRVILAPIK